MTYVIGNACIDVKDQKCVRECPVDCIYVGDRMAYIQPDECIDCGACVIVCPVNAISYDRELPVEQAHLAVRQREAFDVVGAPGGASLHGPIPDHPEVASMPFKG